jgi:hypothetical protein
MATSVNVTATHTWINDKVDTSVLLQRLTINNIVTRRIRIAPLPFPSSAFLLMFLIVQRSERHSRPRLPSSTMPSQVLRRRQTISHLNGPIGSRRKSNSAMSGSNSAMSGCCSSGNSSQVILRSFPYPDISFAKSSMISIHEVIEFLAKKFLPQKFGLKICPTSATTSDLRASTRYLVREHPIIC